MPAGQKVLSEASSVVMGLETALGTAPTSGQVLFQPNPGGIIGWTPKLKTVERDPLSKYASREKGDNVGLDAEPQLVQDLNKDLVDHFGTAMFRTNAKHAGNKGQSLYRPTAVTATGYTVPALGDLTQGLLIFARGFNTAANNGLKVVGAASIGTEIKTSGLTAEAAPPSNVTVGVAGVQGASGDVQFNGSGNIITTILDLTTLGLQVGQRIKIGGTAANTAFANFPLYNGDAEISAIAANLLTLKNHSWTPGAADNGAGKTIQLFFSRFYRNRSLDDADYLEPAHHGELEEIDAATNGTVPTYTYAIGCALKTFEINAPLEDKIVATLSFCALDIADPVLTASRKAGFSTAYAPQASALIDTATDTKRVQLIDSTGALVAEVNSWKLTLEHGTKPRKVQGTFGAIDHTYGKYEPTVSMEAYFVDYAQTKAVRDNRDLRFNAWMYNHQVGFFWNLPYVSLRGGDKQYAQNEPVMISFDVPGFRDPTNNIVQSLSVFEHIPT
jgi:hypothetical protein